MERDLRPADDYARCALCGRTILKGERVERYLREPVQGAAVETVCELCHSRARAYGWVRADDIADLPLPPAGRTRGRRTWLRRLFARRRGGVSGEAAHELGAGVPAPDAPAPAPAASGATNGSNATDANGSAAAHPTTGSSVSVGQGGVTVSHGPRQRALRGEGEHRHVRAVPAAEPARIERALELFAASDHCRTMAGIARALGEAQVAAVASASSPALVDVVVAWELSWYRFRIDLGSERDPVELVERGDEISELPTELRAWNASLDAAGNVFAAA
ncbi:hypothetical protein JDY09_04140 [Thermoleophilum album]|uniref:hypothetical protein n=1 Tax=Thermoleophilum album TaxID=29539 RepID=UPI00237CE61A|nr:hypothetical protein [Thermoleophilum album]WDT94451.1 hypothetical protein JDY09_04140 [Thermoleophilum album]